MKMRLNNRGKIIITGVISILAVYGSFNLVPRNMAILASRTPGRQIVDYLINFVLFFIVIYLLWSLAAWMVKKISSRSK